MNTTMTQHDRISSYIDNELTGEQEQDFLISLASSDTLRKSFRSELVLKNVIHRDDVLTEPSRDLRPAILGVIGVGAAVATAETADAAPATAVMKASGFKTLFATKLNTLITSSLIAVSALGGYTVRTAITPEAPVQRIVVSQPAQTAAAKPLEIQTPVEKSTDASAALSSAPAKSTASRSIAKKSPSMQSQGGVNTPINVVGSNTVNITTTKKK
ncbi:MAG TPA: hypothetical protein VFO76_12060 [Candidatus Kapabacteria bacterium]|nr:hypothetical protein [Candidatus Kapabacteria bacterium]